MYTVKHVLQYNHFFTILIIWNGVVLFVDMLEQSQRMIWKNPINCGLREFCNEEKNIETGSLFEKVWDREVLDEE